MDPSKDGDEDDRFVSSKQRRGESLLRQRTTTTTTVLPKDVSSTIHIKSFYPTHGTTEPHSKGNVSKEEQRTQPLLHNDRQQLINDGQLHLFWVSNWVAGMCSGAVSSIACAPLDLVRTRLQVWSGVVGGRNEAAAGSTLPHDATTPTRRAAPPSAPPSIARIFRDIIQRDGLQGCFRGLTATLLTVPAFWGVYCEYYVTVRML